MQLWLDTLQWANEELVLEQAALLAQINDANGQTGSTSQHHAHMQNIIEDVLSGIQAVEQKLNVERDFCQELQHQYETLQQEFQDGQCRCYSVKTEQLINEHFAENAGAGRVVQLVVIWGKNAMDQLTNTPQRCDGPLAGH